MSVMHLIPTIAYITFITLIIKNILMEIIFTEADIISIKEADSTYKNYVIKKTLISMILKSILFYSSTMCITSFIWFYESCFFAVFKNTQIFVIKNIVISLGLILIFPFVFSFFSGCSKNYFFRKQRKEK